MKIKSEDPQSILHNYPPSSNPVGPSTLPVLIHHFRLHTPITNLYLHLSNPTIILHVRPTTHKSLARSPAIVGSSNGAVRAENLRFAQHPLQSL